MKKLTILGIPGSLRKDSFNRMLLNAAMEAAGEDCQVELASIGDIPLYNQDLEETHGVPDSAKKLQAQIIHCDGLVIATPEYNNSVPGVLKNAIDWLSRPVSEIERVFKDLPVGMIGATPGSRGTSGAQIAWLPVWQALHTKMFNAAFVTLSKAGEVFDEAQHIKSAPIQKQIDHYMTLFVEFVKANRRLK